MEGANRGLGEKLNVWHYLICTRLYVLISHHLIPLSLVSPGQRVNHMPKSVSASRAAAFSDLDLMSTGNSFGNLSAWLASPSSDQNASQRSRRCTAVVFDFDLDLLPVQPFYALDIKEREHSRRNCPDSVFREHLAGTCTPTDPEDERARIELGIVA
jgi:hypothetical protein